MIKLAILIDKISYKYVEEKDIIYIEKHQTIDGVVKEVDKQYKLVAKGSFLGVPPESEPILFFAEIVP